jgi:hypothetical protein
MSTTQKKQENYGLYQTLYSEEYTTEIFSPENKAELLKNMKKLSYDQKKAFLLLICEHAKITDGLGYTDNDIILPYSIVQKNNDVMIDLSSLPNEVKWILWKFIKVIQNEDK